MKQISANELYECLKQDLDLVLIDVRSLDEYRMAHISKAYSLPLDVILNDSHRAVEELKHILNGKKRTVYVVCLSDLRSCRACQELLKLGIHDTCFIRGGTKAWIAAGYPIVSGG